MEITWEDRFKGIGAFWKHDGNPKRPYARLTSGKISNGFFNGEIVAKHAKIFGEACEALAAKATVFSLRDSRFEHFVVGPAMGAIKLSGRIAESFDFFAAYAERGEEGLFVFKRTAPGETARVALCEDTITTGGSLRDLRATIKNICPKGDVALEILALCNRSKNASAYGDEATIPGHRIIALVNRNDMPIWEEGNNPFTPDGRELVPPVRPKGIDNWFALTRMYD